MTHLYLDSSRSKRRAEEMLVTVMATTRWFGVTERLCGGMSGKVSGQTSYRARVSGETTHPASVRNCGKVEQRAWCRSSRSTFGRCVRTNARALRWRVVSSADVFDTNDGNEDSHSVSGVSVRVVEPLPPVDESSQVPSTPTSPPRRKRGRPKGTRKVTNAPVPGDTMGVASLLWRLASDDEALNGTARIQPHGLEAVVPKPKERNEQDDGINEIDDNGASSATTSKETSETPEDDEGTTSASKPSSDSKIPLYRRVLSDSERLARASRNSGLTRTKKTRKKIANTQRQRWARAREVATSKRAADVAAEAFAKQESAIAKAKRAAAEGGAAAAEAAARDDVIGVDINKQSNLEPRSTWEALAAAGASLSGVTNDGSSDSASDGSNSIATDAAERAAAFAALLSDASGVDRVEEENSTEKFETKSEWGSSTGGGALGPGLGFQSAFMSIDQSSDEDTPDDIELRNTKRKMKEQLDNLARRRAEMIGNTGAPSSVTVAKFTNELARYKRLRADLEEWSNAFSEKYRRRPTLKDVERTGIDFLVENFKEYVELRDKLMGQTPHLRGQIEDVAKATLPAPRQVGGVNNSRSNGNNAATRGAAGSAARRIAAAREGKYGAGISAALGMDPAGLGNVSASKTQTSKSQNGLAFKKYGANIGSTSESVNRAASLASKGGGASAEANLAMKRAAAYREQNARRGRGRGGRGEGSK